MTTPRDIRRDLDAVDDGATDEIPTMLIAPLDSEGDGDGPPWFYAESTDEWFPASMIDPDDHFVMQMEMVFIRGSDFYDREKAAEVTE